MACFPESSIKCVLLCDISSSPDALLDEFLGLRTKACFAIGSFFTNLAAHGVVTCFGGYDTV
jgi:hypothetical protein